MQRLPWNRKHEGMDTVIASRPSVAELLEMSGGQPRGNRQAEDVPPPDAERLGAPGSEQEAEYLAAFAPGPDTPPEFKPGVFCFFLPERIERIITQSQADAGEVARLADRGITAVIVPDNDADHGGDAAEQLEFNGGGHD